MQSNKNKFTFNETHLQNIKNKFEEKTGVQLNQNHESDVKFKSVKRFNLKFAIVVATFILITTAVAAAPFIRELFFVPGVGLTSDETITAVSISEPIEITTDRGILTLKFMSKITRDGTNDLVFYIYTNSVLNTNGLNAIININGEKFEVRSLSGGGGGGWESFYQYVLSDFPDVTEFDFTIRGITTPISLTVQSNNFVALSKENNGITLALHKFPQVTDMVGVDILNKNINKDEYNIFISLSPLSYGQFYDVNGDEVVSTGASGGGGGTNNRFDFIYMRNSVAEIKELKANAIEIHYDKNMEVLGGIEIPIPKDGETIKTESQVTICGNIIYEITEVRREGDMIYYKDNSIGYIDFDIDSYEYQEAIKNCVSYISLVNLVWEDFATNPTNSNDKFGYGSDYKTITGFDPDAETLKLGIMTVRVIQFGDFDIEFN